MTEEQIHIMRCCISIRQKSKRCSTYIRAGYGPLNVILNARTSCNRHLKKVCNRESTELRGFVGKINANISKVKCDRNIMQCLSISSQVS